jgi:uncharacterized membrane protein
MEIIGFSVCHQLDSRSLIFGNIISPLCSRCAGIYIGFLISAIILFLMFRKKQSELPPLYVLILLAVFFLSTIIDGLASYLGLYMTNNIIRFSTGFLCGASIMAVLYPVFNYQYYKDPLKEKIFRRPFTFIIFILSLIAFIISTLFRFDFLGGFYYYLSSLSVVFTFFFVSLVMAYLIPFFSQKADRLFSKYLIIPIIIALVLAAVELFIAYKFHELMNYFALPS